ncbi:MAG: hypothetical protein NTZ17_16805 [Phycisphaerae bacterium]|nr:hypothetical protein [Phycisphaerae bacterium]
MVESGGIVMASAAQVLANRLNAQKSTGPRTPEGKEAVSQNAVKHGLLAQQVVIKGEDPGEFDSFRDRMREELAPEGAVEEMLAERTVSLAWRLRRAERLQSAVYETVYRENAQDVVLWPKHGLPIEPRPDETEVILGQVVMTDFAHARVLDRLLVYERRIENSLYRTMAELRKHKKLRETDTPTREPTADKDETVKCGGSVKCKVSSCKSEERHGAEPSDKAISNHQDGRLLRSARNDMLPTSHLRLQTSEEATGDAPTNATSQEPPEGGTPNVSAGDLSCETNPIPWSDGCAERSSPSLPDADQALRSSSTRADCALACQAGFC